jgi:hypothetical protein
MPSNASAFELSEASSRASPGRRTSSIAASAARWVTVGMTSFEDWQRLTWSLGWTGRRAPRVSPSSSLARLAMTSLAFMLVDVPDPVWNTSMTNWVSWAPAITSSQAARMAADSSGEMSSSSWLAWAAAHFTRPSARMKRRPKRQEEMGKFSTARWVCAP